MRIDNMILLHFEITITLSKERIIPIKSFSEKFNELMNNFQQPIHNKDIHLDYLKTT